jgi:hypothetical protein
LFRQPPLSVAVDSNFTTSPSVVTLSDEGSRFTVEDLQKTIITQYPGKMGLAMVKIPFHRKSRSFVIKSTLFVIETKMMAASLVSSKSRTFPPPYFHFKCILV